MIPAWPYSYTVPVTSQVVVVESQLVPTVSYDRLPWLLPAVRQLSVLQQEGRNIPGIGDLRISEQTGANVRRLLAHVRVTSLPVPELAPMSGGGVDINWKVADKAVSFKVFPGDEEVAYMVTGETDEIVDDGVFKLGQNTVLDAALTYLL